MNVENLKTILSSFWFAAKAGWETRNQRSMNTDVRQAIKHMKMTKDTNSIVYNLLLLHRDLGLETILSEDSVVPKGEASGSAPAEDNHDGPSAPLLVGDLAPPSEPQVGQGVGQDVTDGVEEGFDPPLNIEVVEEIKEEMNQEITDPEEILP